MIESGPQCEQRLRRNAGTRRSGPAAGRRPGFRTLRSRVCRFSPRRRRSFARWRAGRKKASWSWTPGRSARAFGPFCAKAAPARRPVGDRPSRGARRMPYPPRTCEHTDACRSRPAGGGAWGLSERYRTFRRNPELEERVVCVGDEEVAFADDIHSDQRVADLEIES